MVCLQRPAWLTTDRAKRLLRVVALFCVVVALGFAPVTVCPMAAVLHLPCPGCGMTRAALSMLHGDLAQAIDYHPLAPILVPLVSVYAIASAVSYIRHGTSRLDAALLRPSTNFALGLLLILLLGLWIARFFGAFGGPVPV